LSAPRSAILAGLLLPGGEDPEPSLDELELLLGNLGISVVARAVQRRSGPDPAGFLGRGKAEELKLAAAAQGADLLVLDEALTPSQRHHLAEWTGLTVWDRSFVIMRIFEARAVTAEAKLQVELARLSYEIPSLKGLGRQMSRLGGGIGTRGPGETEFERHRRKLERRSRSIRRDLEEVRKRRGRIRERRRRSGFPVVALVGYTNAGKSTWMRALTGTDVYVADKLFATLDTTVRSLQPETNPRVLVSDTVGFIEKLPHGLVASFKSTLDEAREASLLLHVVDASDPAHGQQLAATRAVLAEIGAAGIPSIVLLNKVDRVPAEERPFLAAGHADALLVSAKSEADARTVRHAILRFFEGQEQEYELRVPHDQPKLRAALYAEATVLEERYDEDGGTYRVRATPGALERIGVRPAEG